MGGARKRCGASGPVHQNRPVREVLLRGDAKKSCQRPAGAALVVVKSGREFNERASATKIAMSRLAFTTATTPSRQGLDYPGSPATLEHVCLGNLSGENTTLVTQSHCLKR